ncbi:MAG: cupin domain-containing protein [Phycisphaerae bacterium]|nr:cupin domain-containing protein [Phycisphaerae bacterium]
MNDQEIIETLQLQPLPWEGGYYRETYRAEESVAASALPGRYGGDREYCTAIYYLLTPDTISALHRVQSDEIFHFYLGDPVTMFLLSPNEAWRSTCSAREGEAKTVTLGNDIAAGQQVQFVVPKFTWQGAALKEGGRFALMGTTVSPGFEFDDFELASRAKLLADFPVHREWILRLTRPGK